MMGPTKAQVEAAVARCPAWVKGLPEKERATIVLLLIVFSTATFETDG